MHIADAEVFLKTNDLLIIVPCFNEADGLSKLLVSLKKHVPHADIVVIDDGSSDKTYDIASAHTTAIRLISNLGIGGAVQTGFKWAFMHGYSYAMQVDGDGQHPPEEIQNLYTHAVRSQCDMVLGSRFLEVESFRSSWLRRRGIQLISAVIKSIYNKNITDPTSGFRVFGPSAINAFSQNYPSDFPEPISTVIALENKWKVSELPVKMSKREHGESSIKGLSTMIYMLRVLGYMFLVRLGRHL